MEDSGRYYFFSRLRTWGLVFLFAFAIQALFNAMPSSAAAGTVTINGGAPYTNSRTVSLSFSNYPSGTYQFVVSEPGGESTTVTGTGTSFTLSAGDSAKTINVTAYYYYTYNYTCQVGTECCSHDSWGNCTQYCPVYGTCTGQATGTSTFSSSIILDMTKPSGSLTINDGALFTSSTGVSLKQQAADAISGLYAMRFHNGTDGWAAMENYGATKNWSLSDGDGYKLVFAQFQDRAGNWSDPVYSGITLDTTPPASSIGSPAEGACVSGENAVISGTAGDGDGDGSGINKIEVATDGGLTWNLASDTSGNGSWGTWSYTWTLPADGSYAILSRATDNLSHIETPGAGVTVSVDNTAPSSSIADPSASAVLVGTGLAISGTAADGGSGVSKVEVSTDGCETWHDASGTTDWSFDWTLPADGTYLIKTRATDAAGNVETPGTGVTVTIDNNAPSSLITAPAAGVILYGASRDITGTAADGSGSGIQKVEVSMDGGATWNDATGTTNWSYVWTLPADGAYTIKTRATDNAGFTETPGDGVSLSVDNSCPVITAPEDLTVRSAQYSPDLPAFSWEPNKCVKFRVAFSAVPNFKKTLKAVSDNKGIGASYNPVAASWNKLTARGGILFWRVEGTTASKQALNSMAQALVLDGGYSSVSDIPVTDVSSISTVECDPGESQSVLAEFSAEPYFIKPLKSPVLTPGSTISYTPDAAMWGKITKLGPAFYWRFMGKLSTGETTYSIVRVTAVTGGPAITDPAADSLVSYPVTITWDTTGFTSFKVQASTAADFSGKPLMVGSSNTGSLIVRSTAWKKLAALGGSVYIRVVGTTTEKYTAFGPEVKINIAQ